MEIVSFRCGQIFSSHWRYIMLKSCLSMQFWKVLVKSALEKKFQHRFVISNFQHIRNSWLSGRKTCFYDQYIIMSYFPRYSLEYIYLHFLKILFVWFFNAYTMRYMYVIMCMYFYSISHSTNENIVKDTDKTSG